MWCTWNISLTHFLSFFCMNNSSKESNINNLSVVVNSFHLNLHSRLSPVLLHQCLQPEAGPQGWSSPGLPQLCSFLIARVETGWDEEAKSRSKQEYIWRTNVVKSMWFCLGGVVWCSEEDHSGRWHLKTAPLIPESPSTAPDQETDFDVCVWGGECVCIHVTVMLDLDTFQKSTPYALFTEWIILRYTGSRLICR